MLRDGPTALAAKAALGRAARRMWGGKRATDVYDEGSGAEPDSPKARMARTMQHFVDHFDEVRHIEKWRRQCTWLSDQPQPHLLG